MIHKTLEQRIAQYAVLRGDCLVWEGHRNKDGYAVTNIDAGDGIRKNRLVHRLVYMQAFGNIPSGLLVCHKCDNPSCINLDHLWLGTPEANMKDRDRKQRGNFSRNVSGSRNPRAKLTLDQVLEIRKRHVAAARVGPNTTSALAAEFGVHRTHIQRVVRKDQWV
jgi:hypothetical protein